MPGPAQNLALTEIAKLADVGISAASNWRRRHADFPRPVLDSGQELFAASEVARWLDQRKIARNGLQSAEAPGTTYGDRFIRNGGAPALNAAPEPSRANVKTPSGWKGQVWQILDLLRTDLEGVAAVEFVLAMLHLRATNRERWQDMAQQGSWGAVVRAIRNVRLPGQDLALFAINPSDLAGERRLVEAIKLFDEINLENLEYAAMFDALLDKVIPDLGRRGSHFTPPALVKGMMEALDPSDTDTVYDPACGSGEFLVASAQRGVKSISGQAMDVHSLRMATLNLSMRNIEATLGMGAPETAREAFTVQQFDIVVANPPFGMKLPHDIEQGLWPFGVPTRRAARLAWLQIALNKLKPGGRAGIIMPNGTLFSGGQNAEIRREMITAGVVEAIVALPPGLFMATGIAVSLWLIRRPESGEPVQSEVLFVDAADMGTTSAGASAQRILGDDEVAKIVNEYRSWVAVGQPRSSSRSAGFARSVGINEIRMNDYDLMPQRYMLKEPRSLSSPTEAASAMLHALQRELDDLDRYSKRTRIDVDAHLAALRQSTVEDRQEVLLGTICQIQAGPGTVTRERGLTVDGWTPLVLPRNIKRGHLDHASLDTVEPATAAKMVKYRLRQGDIACARSGTLGRHGLVRDAEDGWLLGPSSMRLRITSDGVVPEYLVHYLNGPEVQAWIISEARGSTAIPHVSAATLRELIVRLPSVEVQQNVAAAMDLIDAHVKQTQRTLAAAQSLRDMGFPSPT